MHDKATSGFYWTVAKQFVCQKVVAASHMMTSSNGNFFRVTGPLGGGGGGGGGIHRSPVDSPHKGQNFDIFFDLRLNKRMRTRSRRRW